MKPNAIKKAIFASAIAVLLVFIGMCLGSYQGYTCGYHEGQKTTNTWWIDKQSRYYDPVEVEKKRRSQKYNLL
jgi:membrane protein DedA with SNARE-associated domain